MKYSRGALNFMVNHVILPPKLPQAEDSDIKYELALVQFVREQAIAFQLNVPAENQECWRRITKMLNTWIEVNEHGLISKEALMRAIATLDSKDSIVLHIRSQNAGLLLRNIANGIVFECFEVSPTAEAVMKPQASLRRSFPGRAILLPAQTFHNPQFVSELADFVHRLDSEQVDEVMQKSRKAGTEVVESRDSAHPRLVTELLMTILAPYGSFIQAVSIEKRTRDDVCWSDAHDPWRRCPTWLMLKVAIQLALANSGLPKALTQYKNFMLCLMAELSQLCCTQRLPSDLLYVINAKAARRASKLATKIFDFVEISTTQAIQKTRAQIEENTNAAQQADSIELNPIEPSLADKALSLTTSTPYLTKALERSFDHIAGDGFSPSSFVRLTCSDGGLPLLDFSQVSKQNQAFVLADFENWVRDHLKTWLGSREIEERGWAEDSGEVWINELHISNDCQSLKALMSKYEAVSKQEYMLNPENLSLMLLTILELWCSLDIIAVGLFPILKQYSPEIPVNILRPLLLPRREQLVRIHQIETYLEKRHRLANRSFPSIFGPIGSRSLSVQYFNNSEELQMLRNRIEDDAARAKQEKTRELERKIAHQKSLQEQARNLGHSKKINRQGCEVHNGSCRKCELSKQADNIRISVHEWPLPVSDCQAKACIFELRCPNAISAWRDATFHIIQDLGGRVPKKTSRTEERIYQKLQTYGYNGSQRISLGSTTKSCLRAHYSDPLVPVELSKVTVNNGLNYRVLDTLYDIWTEEQLAIPKFESWCISNLPVGPFSNLQWTVDSTQHTQNEVLAKQVSCSKDLNSHEFVAFGSLRAGERLQWYNILRELASSDLHLDTEAVGTLLVQAAWQAGSPVPNSVLRESHSIFAEGSFCQRMYEVLVRAVEKVEANWKELKTMRVLLTLSHRLLSLATDDSIIQQALRLISKIRRVSLQWTHDLAQNMYNHSQSGSSDRSQQRLLMAALICRMTYSVDSQHVDSLLRNSADIATFIECSIQIHENCPDDVSQLPISLQHALLRDKRLAHSLEPRIAQSIREGNSGLTEGITRIWQQSYLPNTWEFMLAPCDIWVKTKTAPSGDSSSQSVFYNLICGTLLVDGRRLGRLPGEYTEQQLYKKIFGTSILDVVAADEAGMSYTTTRLMSKCKVYFGFADENLLIRIKSGNRYLEAIPSQILNGDVPAEFAKEYLHWLDLDTGVLEFRPIAELWLSNPGNWRLTLKQKPPHMFQGQRLLVDPRSSTCSQINKILKPIESEEFIHVTISSEHEFQVDLPRFRLQFLVKNGQLECPELGTVVSQSQNIGTFHGLKNKLVMHRLGKFSSNGQLSVLIPFGKISTDWFGGATQVHIDPGSVKTVRYFLFQLDQRLRQVRSGSDSAAHFFKTYLHAVTSNVLPDLFTGSTGVEEALSCLLETGAWSCTPLSDEVFEILEMIVDLTPKRTFYPSHLRRMQKTQWNSNLNPLVQHANFDELVKNIIEYSNRFICLHKDMAPRQLTSRGDNFLQKRASHRSLAFYVRGVQDMTAIKVKDLDYKSRDRDESTAAAQRSFEIADTIKRWPSKLKTECDLYSFITQWSMVEGFDQPFEVTSLAELLCLPFRKYWGALYHSCCRMKHDGAFGLAFLFCTLSYRKEGCSPILFPLLALAFTDFSRLPKLPTSGTYELSEGHQLQQSAILDIIKAHEHEYQNADSDVPVSAYAQNELESYRREVRQQTEHILGQIMRQWPQAHPPTLVQSDAPRLDIEAITKATGRRFKTWYRNRELWLHFENIKPILQEMNDLEFVLRASSDYRLDWEPSEQIITTNPVPGLIQLLDNLDCPLIDADEIIQPSGTSEMVSRKDDDFEELQIIIGECASQSDATRSEYGNELLTSLQALKAADLASSEPRISCSPEVLVTYKREAEQLENVCFQAIFDRLQPRPGQFGESLLFEAGLWPRTTPRELLSKLSHVHIFSLTDSWKRALLGYADAVTEHQRAMRLLSSAESGDALAFQKEIRNKSSDGWSPNQHPDWRLMEIENNFLIRPIQARVAKEMMALPKEKDNFVMQLNMGEGKSSVIIPMLACALADGQKLARCIVLKPLVKQMEHLLSRRLGGLVGRRVYYAPFSRKTNLTSEVARQLDDIYHECKDSQGVLLIQPEHILSFRLMSIDRLFANDPSLAIPMLNTQTWLEISSRDLLDESDELLHVNFELAYTIGSQKMLDGQPARWTVVQSLFSLIDKHASSLHAEFPQGIEWTSRGHGSFPTCRILNAAVGAQLMTRLAADILSGHLPGLSFAHCENSIQDAVFKFIMQQTFDPSTIRWIEKAFKDTVQLQILIMLRGLIGHGILVFTLQRKRWLVNYGLHPDRCLMAVPYRAKSTPSVSAEFAHPDVAIVLTCLSYYYTGLSSEQLYSCFNLLSKLIDPSLEYERWQQQSKLPMELQSFSGVNLEDNNQWNNWLFPHLRLNKVVIDFFLSQVVFPREGKEFPYKLSTSAWDLPASRDTSLTTGFSGTNDNRLLLPLNIHQQDLDELKHTGAMVLNTLLRKENREYIYAADNAGQRLTVNQLLQIIAAKQPSIRVLLDVGAQVLEIENRQVIQEWMQLAPDAKAGIFFDSSDELMVIDKEGKLECLCVSSFRERLGECIVYLDEAHTRGTDLAFPRDYRAAVTLGPELTKDRFIQACMRMRNLGHGQSIVCFAPPEVHRSILNLGQRPKIGTDISDVIRWALEQTCSHIDRERALWVSRGLNHTKRRLAHDRLRLEAGSEDASQIFHCDAVEQYLNDVKDREALSLEEMYFDDWKKKNMDLPYGFSDDIDDSVARSLFSEWRRLDKTAKQLSALQEEQEREVAHEIEQERQVQRPQSIKAREHKIHGAVREFIRKGFILNQRDGLKPVLESLQFTTVKKHLIPRLESGVFATDDFIHTVESRPYDDYIRPVRWILVGKGGAGGDILLLSPYEANELLPTIRQSHNVSLNLYAPRTSKSMISFSRLDFLATNPGAVSFQPGSLSALNLFAGTLYFDSFHEYQQFCDLCGLVGGTVSLGSSARNVSSEGFVHPDSRHAVGWSCAFQTSPLPLIKTLLGIRRKGDDWSATHMGQIVDARVLGEEMFRE